MKKILITPAVLFLITISYYACKSYPEYENISDGGEQGFFKMNIENCKAI